MAKTTLKHKTALILGADCPAGRASALQLSREGCHVILAGHDSRRLSLLAELIRNKGGDPLEAVLSRDEDRITTELRHQRDTMGHLHFVINAIAAQEGPVDEPQRPFEDARICQRLTLDLSSGRGNVRLVTLWPDAAGTPPESPAGMFSCLIRVAHIQLEHDGAESEADDAVVVRAGAAADAVVHLLQCPPGACPVEVRVEPREVKG